MYKLIQWSCFAHEYSPFCAYCYNNCRDYTSVFLCSVNIGKKDFVSLHQSLNIKIDGKDSAQQLLYVISPNDYDTLDSYQSIIMI